jgi:hypothetical protein
MAFRRLLIQMAAARPDAGAGCLARDEGVAMRGAPPAATPIFE